MVSACTCFSKASGTPSLQRIPCTPLSWGCGSTTPRWPDKSLPAQQKSAARVRAALASVRQIDADELSAEDRLNHRLFEREYAADVSEQPFHLYLIALDQREGIQNASQVADLLAFDTRQDYEDWIARLEAFPRYMAQTMALLKQGAREGIIHPRVVMQRVPPQIRRQLVDRPENSPYYKPFRTFQVELSESEQRQLRTAAISAIERCILPSYRVFLEFFESEYLPACYEEVGCWRRPDGQLMYAALARRFTTTALTPQEIHQIGLEEVRRIRSEMAVIQKQVKFAGTFQEFLTHLRSDPQFYFETGDELLAAYRACCEKIDPELPKLFLKLPQTDYTVQPIPMQMAPDTTTAYYQPPSADGRRPGVYYVNLYRPEARPKYEIEALSLHESVPGHHFQIALAMELQGIPQFRRYGGYTAFVEGWGLYSEKLGEEMGMYQDPYSRFGQLTYEMWRAVRLVVDTGMHSLKWTRQDAIDFFRDNTAKSLLDIENEVDRYIAWPGQALAYKIGELKIRELRARAEKRLGERFDVREFHDVVLRNGAVPLDILEEIVDAWLIEASLARTQVQ
jgi:uncharacterized protein (DUF885 family)